MKDGGFIHHACVSRDIHDPQLPWSFDAGLAKQGCDVHGSLFSVLLLLHIRWIDALSSHFFH